MVAIRVFEMEPVDQSYCEFIFSGERIKLLLKTKTQIKRAKSLVSLDKKTIDSWKLNDDEKLCALICFVQDGTPLPNQTWTAIIARNDDRISVEFRVSVTPMLSANINVSTQTAAHVNNEYSNKWKRLIISTHALNRIFSADNYEKLLIEYFNSSDSIHIAKKMKM